MANGIGGTYSYDDVARKEDLKAKQSNENKKSLSSAAREADQHSKNCNDGPLGSVKIL